MLSWGNETLKVPSSSPPSPPHLTFPLSRRSSVIDIEYTSLPHSSSCRYCLRFKWRYHKYLSVWVRSCSQFVSNVLHRKKVLRQNGHLLQGTPVFRVWPWDPAKHLFFHLSCQRNWVPDIWFAFITKIKVFEDVISCSPVDKSLHKLPRKLSSSIFCLPTYMTSHPKRLFVMLKTKKTWILFKNSALTAQ